MASTRQLKSRIRSVKSTKQITKAMQMVAASKMRRAQEATKATLAYSTSARELLTYFASQGIVKEHRWFEKRPVKIRTVIIVAADKGMAGAYNSNVFKEYLRVLKEDKAKGVMTKTITVGRKASQFVARLKDVAVLASYQDMPEHPEGAQFHAALNSVKDAYEEKTTDAVDVIYTEFVSSMVQTARTLRIFPAGFTEVAVPEYVREAKYEPSIDRVLDDAAYRLIASQLFQTFLSARASEHSMRMLAMKNATDNASALVDDLTLAMNKARQGAITQELSEISAGVEAMK